MKLIVDIFRAALYSLILAVLLIAVFNPTAFGTWLAAIDAARFSCVECFWEHDYTKDY